MELKVDFTFDEKTYRHYMNGFLTVLHCHHYLCLTTKMAEDFSDLNGPGVLAETTEDTMRPLFDSYYKNDTIDIQEKLFVAAEYYAVMGLGRMTVKAGETGGEVQLLHSHVDKGWLNKWGPHDKPVNHFTRGYIAALFAAAFNKPQEHTPSLKPKALSPEIPAAISRSPPNKPIRRKNHDCYAR